MNKLEFSIKRLAVGVIMVSLGILSLNYVLSSSGVSSFITDWYQVASTTKQPFFLAVGLILIIIGLMLPFSKLNNTCQPLEKTLE